MLVRSPESLLGKGAGSKNEFIVYISILNFAIK